MDRFEESMSEIIGDDEIYSIPTEEVVTSLPFGLGGVNSKPESSLPFGIGSNPQMGFDYDASTFLKEEKVVEEKIQDEDDEESKESAGSEEKLEVEITSASTVSSPATPTPSTEASLPLSSPSVQTPKRVQAVPIVESSPVDNPQVVEKVIAVTINESPSGENPSDENPSGENPSGENPSGENPSGENPHLKTENSLEPSPLHQENDVVIHDFSKDELFTEVIVNLDDIAEPVTSSDKFNPTESGNGITQPKLYPSRAMEVNTDGESELADWVELGFNAMGDSKWKVAAKSFQNVVKKRPNDSAAMNNYGIAILQRAIATVNEEDPYGLLSGVDTHFEGAIMALRQAAKMDGSEPVVLFNLASALCLSGRYDKALRIFSVYLDRAGDVADGYNGKAASLLGLGQINEALVELRMAEKLDVESLIIQSNLSQIKP